MAKIVDGSYHLMKVTNTKVFPTKTSIFFSFLGYFIKFIFCLEKQVESLMLEIKKIILRQENLKF